MIRILAMTHEDHAWTEASTTTIPKDELVLLGSTQTEILYMKNYYFLMKNYEYNKIKAKNIELAVLIK